MRKLVFLLVLFIGKSICCQIGIGTASPSSDLDIEGNSTTTGIDINNASASDFDAVLSFQLGGTSQFMMGVDDSDADKFKIGTTALGTSTFLTINSSGQMGIGTSNPAALLEIEGASFPMFTVGEAASVEGQVVWDHTNNKLNISTFSHTYPIQFGNAAFYIETDGDVGMGTSTPSTELDIEDSETTVAIDINNTSGSDYDPEIRFQLSGTSAFTIGVDDSDSDKLKIGTTAVGTSTRLTIDGSGNVGVGTDAPSQLLSITSGNFLVTNPDNAHGIEIMGDNATTDYSAIQFKEFGVAHAGIRWDGNDMEFCEASAGTDPDGWTARYTHVILSTNRIGINETAPDVTLDVNVSSGTVGDFNRTTSDGTVISIQQAGVEEGTISVSGTTVSYNAFTGSHFGWTTEPCQTGELVSFTGDNRFFHDKEGYETIYGFQETTLENDRNVIGAYLGLLNPQNKPSADNPYQVMAVGNGKIWVVDNGEDLRPGDYLISSPVKGHAMKDNGNHETSYIIARMAEEIEWDQVDDYMEDGRRHIMASVYFENFEKQNWDDKLRQQQEELDELRKKIEELKNRENSLGG